MISNDDSTSSSSTDDIFEPIPSKRRRVSSDSEESSSSSSSDTVAHSTTDDSDNNEEEKVLDTNWETPSSHQPKDQIQKIRFSSSSGVNTRRSEISQLTEPHSFYCLFASNEIFEMIAKQTNKYAAKIVSEQRSGRIDKWIETNPNEIKRFFGLIIWMGLVRLPKTHLYWSRNEEYHQTFPSTVMSRNRFEVLLRFIYFSDIDEDGPSNNLSKITPITDLLNRSFKEYYKPNETLCVDEWLVPFQGRIIRQYLKGKRQRCGIKIVKLCCGPGYTYSIQSHSEKDISRDKTAGTVLSDIVMSLCSDVLGKGHTICTDNKYTSVDLAEKLIANNTHLLGTLRPNQRGNSLELVSKKLKRGEVIARENKSGITILKWKDKRDVLMLSTKHSAEMTTIHKKFYLSEKPKMVVEYNLAKSSVDLSDQMTVYHSPLGRSLKWYRKLAMELLLNTCMVNSMILFKKVTTRDIQVSDFRMKVAMYLTKCRDESEVSHLPSKGLPRKRRHDSKAMPGKPRHDSKAMAGKPRHDSKTVPGKQPHDSKTMPGKPRHELQAVPGKVRIVRRFCKNCYQRNSEKLGRTSARNYSKKVVTYCKGCVGTPFLCLECFIATHRNM